MSTVFGIFRPDGGPPASDEVEAMRSAMDHWHADDTGIHLSHDLMLGHLMLHNTPESLREHNPIEVDGLMITADARLYNRDEILRLLRQDRQQDPATPDSVLILLLYRQMGARCLEKLVGDFAFAIWDAAKRELFCARDQLGVRPFFHYHRNGLYVFASEKKGILAHPLVEQDLDREFIRRLVGDLSPEPDATFHAHVKHLPPAHFARITPSGIEVRRYWQLGIPSLLRLRTAGDYEEAFREQLSVSVSCRLRTAFPLGAELSGGLDSSAVTALAAAQLGDPDRLFTFSNVLPTDAQGAKESEDEEPYIDDVVRHCGIRHPVKVTHSGRQDLFGPLDLDIRVNSGVDIISSFWLEPFRMRMEERDVRVCLSGFFGDEMTTNPGRNYFFDFPGEGRYLDFAKAAWQQGRYALPVKALLKSLLPDAVLDMVRGSGMPPAAGRNYLKGPGHDGHVVGLHGTVSPDRQYSYKGHLVALSSNIHALRRMQSESLFGIMHRVEPRYPLADIRLLEFFLSLPTAQIGHPRIERYMYRRSLRGIVPESVLRRTDKRVPAGVFLVREARETAPAFRSWVRDLASGPDGRIPDWIDLGKIMDGLDPGNPANRWNGSFYPSIPFGILSLLRYLSGDDPGPSTPEL